VLRLVNNVALDEFHCGWVADTFVQDYTVPPYLVQLASFGIRLGSESLISCDDKIRIRQGI
jgi:hypothetical protein